VKSIVLSFALLVSVVSLMAGSIFAVRTMSSEQAQIRRVDRYEHPCIVLKVDNYGCQAEIEMRTRMVRAPRLDR
jgi:hypothetical protein